MLSPASTSLTITCNLLTTFSPRPYLSLLSSGCWRMKSNKVRPLSPPHLNVPPIKSDHMFPQLNVIHLFTKRTRHWALVTPAPIKHLSNPLIVRKTFLVANHGQTCQKVHERMPGMYHNQNTLTPTLGKTATSTNSPASLCHT